MAFYQSMNFFVLFFFVHICLGMNNQNNGQVVLVNRAASSNPNNNMGLCVLPLKQYSEDDLRRHVLTKNATKNAVMNSDAVILNLPVKGVIEPVKDVNFLNIACDGSSASHEHQMPLTGGVKQMNDEMLKTFSFSNDKIGLLRIVKECREHNHKLREFKQLQKKWAINQCACMTIFAGGVSQKVVLNSLVPSDAKALERRIVKNQVTDPAYDEEERLSVNKNTVYAVIGNGYQTCIRHQHAVLALMRNCADAQHKIHDQSGFKDIVLSNGHFLPYYLGEWAHKHGKKSACLCDVICDAIQNDHDKIVPERRIDHSGTDKKQSCCCVIQ